MLHISKKMSRRGARTVILQPWMARMIMGVITGISVYAVFRMVRTAFTNVLPGRSRQEIAKGLQLIQRISATKGKDVKFNEYESVVANDLLLPGDIKVTFEDIGGMEEIKKGVMESVIFPIRHQEVLKNSNLLDPPKGVLFYGPPGTGKTMMVKAIAKQSEFNFLSINISSLLDKWLGESQKLAKATFTLAQKIQPCIIFIDEIDGIFGRRDDPGQHSSIVMMQSEILTLWDGMRNEKGSMVIVIGTTNRKGSIDPAVLRRMPFQYEFPKPDEAEREKILRKILEGEECIGSMDYGYVAKETSGYTGSDLQELCKKAKMRTVSEYIQEHGIPKQEEVHLRPLSSQDIIDAMAVVKPVATEVDFFQSHLSQLKGFR